MTTYVGGCGFRERSQSAARALLSLGEAVVLADVSEKRVRKDIETGVLPSIVRLEDARLCFQWADVFTLAAVYRHSHLSRRWRKLALEKVECVSGKNAPLFLPCANRTTEWHRVAATATWHSLTVTLEGYLTLDLGRACEDVKPRVDLYAEGLSRIEEKESVLGGDAVFKDTRLSVCHVGKMYDGGETAENIINDYPNLSKNDIKFAQLYYLAHPPVGRPRKTLGAGHDGTLVAG